MTNIIEAKFEKNLDADIEQQIKLLQSELRETRCLLDIAIQALVHYEINEQHHARKLGEIMSDKTATNALKEIRG